MKFQHVLALILLNRIDLIVAVLFAGFISALIWWAFGGAVVSIVWGVIIAAAVLTVIFIKPLKRLALRKGRS